MKNTFTNRCLSLALSLVMCLSIAMSPGAAIFAYADEEGDGNIISGLIEEGNEIAENDDEVVGIAGFAAASGNTYATGGVTYVEGATTKEDANSPTGYTVTFVYQNSNATSVKLAGDLTMRDVSDPLTPTVRYQPEDYSTGKYHAGGVEFLRDMTHVGDGYWAVSIPMHAGALSYWYRVDDPTQGWTNKRIWDPTADHIRPPGDTSYRTNHNDVLGAVYVPYDPKQNDPILEQRAKYELPLSDPAQRGNVEWVEYTTNTGADGFYLGVYTPNGYNPNRTKPYKVMYLGHGIFGDETDWMIPGSVPNILDNMIARGEIEPMVIVTMGNHFNGNYPYTSTFNPMFMSYTTDSAAKNLAETILPFVEENYNVWNTREGRAYGGFSMGGMTGGIVMRDYHEMFGYFGFFSGDPLGNPMGSPAWTDETRTAFYDKIAAESGANVPFVFLGNGSFEGPLTNFNDRRDNFRTRGIPSETHQVPGAHDMMTAGQLFTTFAKEYLWQMGESGEMTEGATVTKDPTSPTGYTVTFVYKNSNATSVKLAGDLTMRDVSDPLTPTVRYQPEEYSTGKYHAGGVEFLRDMTYAGNGYWSVSIPMHAGGLSYWYRVDDPTQGWTNKRIWDPAASHIRPPGDTSYRTNHNDVLDTVYVPYDPKQNDPILEQRAKYELPVSNPAQRGNVEWVEYTTNTGAEGFYLGVYTPSGYDPNRAKPYKVMYLGHGIFGDETDWMIPGNVPNILDNMIARGEIEPMVIITMGNHFNGNYPYTSTFNPMFMSYTTDSAAKNLAETILPFVEKNYNVWNTREGRAYGGFSMGGMTGGIVMRDYHKLFGYFGFFSGDPLGNPMGSPAWTDETRTAFYDKIAAESGANVPFVFLGNGSFEGPLTNFNDRRDNFRSRGIPSETHQVPGAHDMMTAGQLFTVFAKEYLWKMGKPEPTGTDSSSSSGSGGSSGGSVSSTVTVKPLDSANAASEASKAVAGDGVAKFKNISTITLDTLKAMIKAAKGKALHVNVDSMSEDGKSVDVRIAFDPSDATGNINVHGSTYSAAAASRKAMFEKWFSNKVTVISLSQKGSFGMTVKIAAKANFKEMDTKNLVFYSYNAETNKYTRIKEPMYRVDKKGYIHFYTVMGGDIIISEGPLNLK